MENFWNIVSGAPWWVYVLFLYLVLVGIKSTQPRTISLQRLLLLPLLFVAWSFYGLLAKLTLEMFSLVPLWIVFLAIGSYLGMKEVQSWKIRVDRKEQTITLPPNYSTLVLIVLIFVLKFFWGYLYDTRKEISYWIYFFDTLTSSLVTGFFIGRAAVFFKAYRKKH